jgi:hypothetical protein
VLTIAQAVAIVPNKQRRILKIVETGAAHSTEVEAVELLVRLPSFALVGRNLFSTTETEIGRKQEL